MAGTSRTNPYASLGAVDNGMIQPGTGGAAFPDKPCKLIKFKAGSTNTGVVSIGKTPGTTAGNTAGGGHQLSAREDSGWIPITNANRFMAISTVAGDWVSWITLG